MSGWTFHAASLPYIQTDLRLECCSYGNGSGLPLAFGVGGEYWIRGDVALMGTIGYRAQGGSFVTDGDTMPRVGMPSVITRYELSTTFHYLALSVGAKYRLFASHATVGFGLRAMVSVGSSSVQKEVVQQPSDFVFPSTKSGEFQFPGTTVADLKPFLLVPYLQLGYDISVARGAYLSPTFSIGLPLMNVTTGGTWRMTELGLGVRFMKGF